jgi:hypothetical protein
VARPGLGSDMGSMLALITDGSTAFIAFTVMMILIFVALVVIIGRER